MEFKSLQVKYFLYRWLICISLQKNGNKLSKFMETKEIAIIVIVVIIILAIVGFL